MEKLLYVILWVYLGLFFIDFATHSFFYFCMVGVWVMASFVILLHVYAQRMKL